MDERPGAAYIELPEDIAEETTDAKVFDVIGHRQPDANPPSVLQAVEIIKEAKYPHLPIGAGANQRRASESLNNLVDKSGL